MFIYTFNIYFSVSGKEHKNLALLFSPLYIQATQQDRIYLQNLANYILLLELERTMWINSVIKHLRYFPQRYEKYRDTHLSLFLIRKK